MRLTRLAICSSIIALFLVGSDSTVSGVTSGPAYDEGAGRFPIDSRFVAINPSALPNIAADTTAHPLLLTVRGKKAAERVAEGDVIGSNALAVDPSALEYAANPSPNTPLLGGSFQGDATGALIPPDPAIAAGPHDLLVATNNSVQVFRKNGTRASFQFLETFFAAPPGARIFDPVVLYDEYIDRFWAVATSRVDGPNASTIHVALSVTSEARDGFTLFPIDAMPDGDTPTNNWCDYPRAGIDAQALYVTCNMFSFPRVGTSFQYSKIRVMTKDQFLDSADEILSWDFFNIFEGFPAGPAFTIQPAYMEDATAAHGEFLVDAHGGGGAGHTLEVYRITNPETCCIPGSQAAPTFVTSFVQVSGYDFPPAAPQAGTNPPLVGAGDTRLLFAFWRNGRLNTGHTTSCGGIFIGFVACPKFTELDMSQFPGTVTAVNDWILEDQTGPRRYRYFPGVAINDSGARTMVYTRSSSTEFPSALYIGIPPTDLCTACIDGPEALLAAGRRTYIDGISPAGSPQRWGDYAGAAADPDGTGIWLHSEFASATEETWATQVGLTREPMDTAPPVTSGAVTPVPNNAGWNNERPVTVNLTSADSGVAGVRRIRYSASGAYPLAVTTVSGSSTSFEVDAEGTTFVSFTATDNWGNVENTKTLTVRIDTIPPMASIRIPTSVGESVAVAFSERVRGVTPSNLVLRILPSLDAVPAAITCRDASAGLVNCGSRNVRRAVLDPTDNLLSGREYSVRVSPLGSAPARDRAGNPVPRTTRRFQA